MSFLTVSQAAALSGRCAATIRSQFDAGLLTGTVNEYGHRLIDPESLNRPNPAGHTVSQAAKALNVSAETVRRWFDTGRLTGHRDQVGRRRIDIKSVRSHLRKAAR